MFNTIVSNLPIFEYHYFHIEMFALFNHKNCAIIQSEYLYLKIKVLFKKREVGNYATLLFYYIFNFGMRNVQKCKLLNFEH